MLPAVVVVSIEVIGAPPNGNQVTVCPAAVTVRVKVAVPVVPDAEVPVKVRT